MKNEKKAAELSKMSLAAKKAWETRRKRYGNVKNPRSEDEPEVVVEQLKRRYRGRKCKDEQLKRAYHKGQLMPKGKRENHRKSFVKYGTEEGNRVREFLYGSKWIEDVVLQKLWLEAKKLAKALIWREEGQKLLVVAK